MNPFPNPMAFGRARATLKKLALVACGCVLLGSALSATPAEEITRAVAANGVADVSQARSRQFVKAFTAVALGAQPRDLPQYVIAAVDLRPDLVRQTVAVAIKAAVKNWEGKSGPLCALVERIVRAAITAQPDAAVSIAKAGSLAMPEMRRCVIEAAVASAPEKKDAIVEAASAKSFPFAFLTFSATDSSGFSFSAATLSPANISESGDDDSVNSPEQPPSH